MIFVEKFLKAAQENTLLSVMLPIIFELCSETIFKRVSKCYWTSSLGS